MEIHGILVPENSFHPPRLLIRHQRLCTRDSVLNKTHTNKSEWRTHTRELHFGWVISKSESVISKLSNKSNYSDAHKSRIKASEQRRIVTIYGNVTRWQEANGSWKGNVINDRKIGFYEHRQNENFSLCVFATKKNGTNECHKFTNVVWFGIRREMANLTWKEIRQMNERESEKRVKISYFVSF